MDIEAVLKEMTLEEKANLCSGRDFWHSQNIDRVGIPSVMLCDGPNGLRKQKGKGDHLGINVSIETVCYPTASAMAASFDTELLGELGENLGEECRAEKVAMLLGPGVNMKRSPLCGRNFEYFSEDPYLAGKLAAAYIRGLQSKGVSACVKHFAANNQETRRMSGSSNIEKRAFYEIYLPAFEAAVKEGKVRSVMCAYNAVNGTFCSENGELLTEILRKNWGFDGMVVTDWGASKDRAKGIAAGVDLEMPGRPESSGAPILKAIREGRLTETQLDTAVKNILQMVADAADAGLVPQNADDVLPYNREKAQEKSGEFAVECAVLMKNDGILPLADEERVVFIGEFAEKPRYQGAGSSHINVVKPVSALDAIGGGRNVTYVKGYQTHEEKTDPELLAQAVEAAGTAETAVIFAGLPESYETEGADRDHMRLPENQNELIRAVAAVQKRTVVVLHGGAPAELPWAADVPAILCMYLGGSSVGTAEIQLLYGEKNPSGHLAETWPLRLADNPSYLNFPGEDGTVTYRENLFIGYRYYDKKQMEVLFPFGHGLSYTTFEYSDLKLDKEKMADNEELTVSCKVKNIGSRAGKEVVQLYVSDLQSTVIRPIRELKGFCKVSLQPGEEKEVTFTLGKRAFAYYEEKIADWFVESGAFSVEIGSSSRDIRLKGTMEVTSTRDLPFVYTSASTVSDLAKTANGRKLLEKLNAMAASRQGSGDENLGEGAKKMEENMMKEMPLAAFCAYGLMDEEGLAGLIRGLNS